jgi:formylglycine-generating enzyme required for sulfatase activity
MMGTDSADLRDIMERFGITRIEILQSELPQHSIRVRDFFLDVTDVTNADFLEFVQARPEWGRTAADSALHNGRYLEHWSSNAPDAEEFRRPVTFVTWYAAVAYCHWRGKRLPTEAEWELAAGGGDATREFPWGSAAPSNELVTWSGGGHDRPEPVATHPPTQFGLYDMAGNVWKFLADSWRDSYRGGPQKQELLDPDTARRVTTRRVVRGGSYGAAAINLRVRYRDSHRPDDAREMVGFRCAMSAHEAREAS